MSCSRNATATTSVSVFLVKDPMDCAIAYRIDADQQFTLCCGACYRYQNDFLMIFLRCFFSSIQIRLFRILPMEMNDSVAILGILLNFAHCFCSHFDVLNTVFGNRLFDLKNSTDSMEIFDKRVKVFRKIMANFGNFQAISIQPLICLSKELQSKSIFSFHSSRALNSFALDAIHRLLGLIFFARILCNLSRIHFSIQLQDYFVLHSKFRLNFEFDSKLCLMFNWITKQIEYIIKYLIEVPIVFQMIFVTIELWS